ncbi:hypothetical protein Tco_0639040 [Tanacetum coccineum]
MYEKIKRSDEDFISIGSAEDERLIKRMNEKGIDSSKNEMVKEESKEEVKEENKEEESTRKRKLGTRKKMKSRKRRFIQNTSEDDSEKENDELRLHLTIAPDEEKEVDYEILDRKYPIKEWKIECLGIKPQDDKAEHLEEINQNVVIRSNGNKGGDLMIMFNPDDEDKFWNSQQDWNIVSWKLHGSSGVYTLVTEAGMYHSDVLEKKYHLEKEKCLEPEDVDGDVEDPFECWCQNTQQMVIVPILQALRKLASHKQRLVSLLVQDQTVPAWLVQSNGIESNYPRANGYGKGNSIPLMAGSLPKTTKPT